MIHVFFFFLSVRVVYLIFLCYHYNFLCQRVGVGRGFGVHMYLFEPWRLGAAASDNIFFFSFFFLAIIHKISFIFEANIFFLCSGMYY